jgi:hypothetical protein
VNRFEQETERTFDQFQVNAQRGIEIGKDLANDRYAVVTLAVQGLELRGGHGLLQVNQVGRAWTVKTAIATGLAGT